MRDCSGSGTENIPGHEIPRGITAVGVFLFFGATMATLAGTTLSWPGTSLDRLWALNPTAHKQLATFARPAGILLLVLAATLALAGTGWFKRRLWGGDWPWRLSRPRFWVIWSIASGVIIGDAVLASVLRRRCCFISYVQR